MGERGGSAPSSRCGRSARARERGHGTTGCAGGSRQGRMVGTAGDSYRSCQQSKYPLRDVATVPDPLDPNTTGGQTERPNIFVVMPAYNAAKTLAATHAAIPRDLVSTVLLVDDHSADQTVDVATNLGLQVIRHPHNVGYGGNQKTCYMEALRSRAEIVVMLHPDGQYDPTLIPSMIEPILQGQADMVLGPSVETGWPPNRSYAPLQSLRQSCSHNNGEPGLGHSFFGASYRLSRLQPEVPRDCAVPTKCERVRL